ncbi:MAG TPA: hypothetical protein VLE96_06890 [Chlamydiales bacterium]|nr:hypothetical protein [Chlamydiales bacterium]
MTANSRPFLSAITTLGPIEVFKLLDLGISNPAPKGAEERYTNLPFLASLVQKGADLKVDKARKDYIRAEFAKWNATAIKTSHEDSSQAKLYEEFHRVQFQRLRKEIDSDIAILSNTTDPELKTFFENQIEMKTKMLNLSAAAMLMESCEVTSISFGNFRSTIRILIQKEERLKAVVKIAEEKFPYQNLF